MWNQIQLSRPPASSSSTRLRPDRRRAGWPARSRPSRRRRRCSRSSPKSRIARAIRACARLARRRQGKAPPRATPVDREARPLLSAGAMHSAAAFSCRIVHGARSPSASPGDTAPALHLAALLPFSSPPSGSSSPSISCGSRSTSGSAPRPWCRCSDPSPRPPIDLPDRSPISRWCCSRASASSGRLSFSRRGSLAASPSSCRCCRGGLRRRDRGPRDRGGGSLARLRRDILDGILNASPSRPRGRPAGGGARGERLPRQRRPDRRRRDHAADGRRRHRAGAPLSLFVRLAARVLVARAAVRGHAFVPALEARGG